MPSDLRIRLEAPSAATSHLPRCVVPPALAPVGVLAEEHAEAWADRHTFVVGDTLLVGWAGNDWAYSVAPPGNLRAIDARDCVVG